MLESLSAFTINPAGSVIVKATGPIRQIVQNGTLEQRRYLVIAEGSPSHPGRVVQRKARD